MENQDQIQQPQMFQEKPKQNGSGFLVGLLSTLLLLASIIAGFFAYQTQKLVSELRVMSEELKQAAKTPEPTTSPLATPDPTADWKTYTNTKYGYSFKYSGEFELKNISGESITVPQNTSGVYLVKKSYPDYANRVLEVQYLDIFVPPVGWTSANVVVGGQNAKRYMFVGGDATIKFDIYQVPLTSGGIEIMVNKQMLEDIDQILSTFKFTN